MLGTLAISVAVAAVLVAAWYICFSRYNRKRALTVLRWLESALGGHGHVVGVQWLGPSCFLVPLRLTSAVFQRASMRVEMAPRELPLQWLLRRWRRQPDVLVFCADLDVPPQVSLELRTHRWSGRTSRKLSQDVSRWTVDQSTPLILTSRAEWDLGGVVESLLATPHREFLSLRIRRTSPHIEARVALESLSPQSPTCGQVFHTLREVAAGASTSRP